VEGITDSRRRIEFAMPEEKIADNIRGYGFGEKISNTFFDILSAEKGHIAM
jgi:hypothetical protein